MDKQEDDRIYKRTDQKAMAEMVFIFTRADLRLVTKHLVNKIQQLQENQANIIRGSNKARKIGYALKEIRGHFQVKMQPKQASAQLYKDEEKSIKPLVLANHGRIRLFARKDESRKEEPVAPLCEVVIF